MCVRGGPAVDEGLRVGLQLGWRLCMLAILMSNAKLVPKNLISVFSLARLGFVFCFCQAD